MGLVIRKAQIAALQLDLDARWCDGQLAELYPSFASAPPAQRRQWIDQGIQRARASKLDRPEFLQFLSFEQTFSPGCLEEPSFDWARRILGESGKTSADRMKRLRQQSIHRLLAIETKAQAATEASAGEA